MNNVSFLCLALLWDVYFFCSFYLRMFGSVSLFLYQLRRGRNRLGVDIIGPLLLRSSLRPFSLHHTTLVRHFAARWERFGGLLKAIGAEKRVREGSGRPDRVEPCGKWRRY